MSQASVLIVDDNEDLCQTLADVLRKGRNKVRTSYTGEHALSILRKDIIDLVLLDIKLPDVNGTAVCKSIRSNSKYEHIRIIIISGVADPDEVEELRLAGADDFIRKPFDINEVISRMVDLVGAEHA